MDAKVKVLVVEDQEEHQKIFRRHIERLGYTCDIAETVNKAKELLLRTFFHIVILDLSLEPDQSDDRQGFKVLDMIRNLDQGTQIIIQSAYGGLADANIAIKKYETHVSGFIDKMNLSKELINDEVAKALEKVGRETMQPFRRSLDIEKLLGNVSIDHLCEKVLDIREAQTKSEIQPLLNRLLMPLLPLIPAKKDALTSHTTENNQIVARLCCWSKLAGSPVEAVFGRYETVHSLVQPIHEIQFKRQFDYLTKVNEVFDPISLKNLGGVVYTVKNRDLNEFSVKNID